MAIQFEPNALSRFADVNFRENDAIANLDGKDGLKKNGTRGWGVFSGWRSGDTKRSNNAVRTELLKALGRAFHLEGVGELAGKPTFSEVFMNKLAEIIGPEFKREDFGINAAGEVDSGKPLTQRRIRSIIARAESYRQTGFDYASYKKKCSAIVYTLEHKSFPFSKMGIKDSAIRLYKRLDKILDFLDKELDGLIVENENFNELNDDARYLINTRRGRRTVQKPLTDINDVSNYINRRIGAPLHIGTNIIERKKFAFDSITGKQLDHARLQDLDNPAKQIRDYIWNAFTNYAALAIDLFFASERKGEAMLDKFLAEVNRSAICIEGKMFQFSVFQAENNLAADHAVSLEFPVGENGKVLKLDKVPEFDASHKLSDRIGVVIDALHKANPGVELKWDECAVVVKHYLKGETLGIQKAEKEDYGDGDYMWNFVPVTEGGKPVVRKVTDEDLDALGPAVLDFCSP